MSEGAPVPPGVQTWNPRRAQRLARDRSTQAYIEDLESNLKESEERRKAIVKRSTIEMEDLRARVRKLERARRDYLALTIISAFFMIAAIVIGVIRQ